MISAHYQLEQVAREIDEPAKEEALPFLVLIHACDATSRSIKQNARPDQALV
jgi:hypothetical protein